MMIQMMIQIKMIVVVPKIKVSLHLFRYFIFFNLFLTIMYLFLLLYKNLFKLILKNAKNQNAYAKK